MDLTLAQDCECLYVRAQHSNISPLNRATCKSINLISASKANRRDIRCISRWIGQSACFVVLLAFFAMSNRTALAWSSMDRWTFKPVHQQAIEIALKGKLSVAALKVLIDAQTNADDKMYQTTLMSFRHAMAGLEDNSKDVAVSEAKFRDKYRQAAELFIRDAFGLAADGKQEDNENKAFSHLGLAIHALQDATSPSHEGFQGWTDNFSLLAKATHIYKERVFPNDSSKLENRRNLLGVVRWAYGIFTGETTMPGRFFNASSGNIESIPRQYLEQ